VYIPRTFRMSESDASQFIADHPFAVLFSASKDGEPLATHLPLLLREEGRLIGHMARANSHWRHLDGARVLAVFSGPHAYISPEWYGSMPNVPTWNYVTVHATGTCRILQESAALVDVLRELSGFMEADSPIPGALSAPAHPDHAYYMAEVPAIVGFEIHVDRLEGKAKLGQNRSRKDREGAVAGLLNAGDPDSAAIARRMLATLGEEPGDR
jgi:transcriptional regulator